MSKQKKKEIKSFEDFKKELKRRKKPSLFRGYDDAAINNRDYIKNSKFNKSNN